MPIVLVESITERTYQTTVGSVISKARRILQDEDDSGSTGYRWTDIELIGWINQAVASMIGIVPMEFAKVVTHTCAEGYRQKIVSARAVSLIDIIGIPPADAMTLTQFKPGWQEAAAGAAKNWMRVNSEPLGFFLTPPSQAAQSLLALVIEIPESVSSTSDVVPVSENYEPAIVQYVVAMALMKDDEAVDGNRFTAALQIFVKSIQGVS